MRRAGKDYEDKQMSATPRPSPPPAPVTPPPTPPESVPMPPEPEPTDEELEEQGEEMDQEGEDAGEEQPPLTDTEAGQPAGKPA